MLQTAMVVVLLCGPQTLPASPRSQSLDAKRWWNAATTQPANHYERFLLAQQKSYALLCFRKEDGGLLRDIVPRLNRLQARQQWNVIGLSPDDPNEILPLVYRYRLRFPVGAGTQAHRSLGVHKLPCLVLLRAGGGVPEILENVPEAAERTLGENTTSRPATVPWPDAPEKVGPDTPVDLLEACAVEAPSAEVRLAALRLLQAQLPAEQFQIVLEEAMAAEPPDKYKGLLRPAFWYGLKLGAFTGAPDVLTYPGWTVRQRHRTVLDIYQTLTAGMNVAQLAQAYLEHGGTSDAELLFRNAVIEQFDQADPAEVQGYLPELILAERDVSLRFRLVGMAGDAWLKGVREHASDLAPALLDCLGPDQHVFVRALAQALLELIYDRQP